MKIKFTITLTDETVRGFKAEGFKTGEDIKDAIVEHVRDYLGTMADSMDDDDDEDEDDDDEG